MDFGAAQLLHRHCLSQYLFDDGRPSNEHLAAVLNHENKISQSRRIGADTDAGPHNSGDLWNAAGGNTIFKKDLADRCGDRKAFLDSRSRGIVETDKRYPQLTGRLNDISNFLCMSAADGAGENCAILRENVNRSAVNFSEAGDNPVGGDFFLGHAEIHALCLRQHELFDKAAGIEKLVNALTGRQLAFGALLRRYFGSPSEARRSNAASFFSRSSLVLAIYPPTIPMPCSTESMTAAAITEPICPPALALIACMR